MFGHYWYVRRTTIKVQVNLTKLDANIMSTIDPQQKKGPVHWVVDEV
jgi:hypothetical protein